MHRSFIIHRKGGKLSNDFGFRKADFGMPNCFFPPTSRIRDELSKIRNEFGRMEECGMKGYSLRSASAAEEG